MSTQTAAEPTRRATTTYAQLTERAARCIARARIDTVSAAALGQGPNAVDLAAHRDLADALVRLAVTLVRPLDGSTPAPAKRRRGGPDSRLLRALESVAQPRSWSDPRPTDGPSAALDQAARLIRAAADLWATHHGADGRPRSPEASRMRHPSTLGAASREWRTLVELAAEAADASAETGRADALPEPVLEALRSFPRPRAQVSGPAGAGGALDLTVARPGIRPGQAPLTELADRVARLRHLAWTLSEVGSAPSTVHGNLAAIGIALHLAARRAHLSLAEQATNPTTRGRHLDAAWLAASAESQWLDIAGQVRALRTPHPSSHPIQIERLDIDRLLSRAAPSGIPLSRPKVAWALSRIAGSFAEVAAHNAVALRAAQDRGDLLLVGRAIPTDALPRRPDLLEARLTDQVIPAPTSVVATLESSYRAIARESGARLDPEISPPAA
ncbi:MAG TPA: hypothetical protein VES03_09355 [Motilibacterales bacterium]|nr:hypothetical protein [Motilibacterales bacterium]